jgi:hypothetical protein
MSGWRNGIEQRMRAASRGPWSLVRDPENGMLLIHNAEGRLVSGEADAAFIAHARQDIPKLLEEVERARLEAERTQKTLSSIKRWAEEIRQWAQESVDDHLAKEEEKADYRTTFYMAYVAKRLLNIIEEGAPEEEATR